MFGSATSKIRGATSVGKAVVVLLVVGFAAGTLTCANGQEYALVGSDDKGPPVGSTDINPNAMQAPTKSPIDECSDDPSCRLEVTSEQLHGLYGSTNQWIPLLGFAHFKPRRGGNLQVGGTGQPGLSIYPVLPRTVKNPRTPATGGGAPGRWHPQKLERAWHTMPRCDGLRRSPDQLNNWGCVSPNQ